MRRRALVVLLFFGAALAALFVSYPFSTQYEGTDFSRATTLQAYVLLASISAVIALGIDEVSVELVLRRIGDPVARWIVGGVLVFVALASLALAFGTGVVDIPGTRIHGIFFAECGISRNSISDFS